MTTNTKKILQLEKRVFPQTSLPATLRCAGVTGLVYLYCFNERQWNTTKFSRNYCCILYFKGPHSNFSGWHFIASVMFQTFNKLPSLKEF